jgi:2-polyprenyl-6-hydroxyphenyl methylase/3-demethylubiquinone-9 3-methyltransferase
VRLKCPDGSWVKHAQETSNLTAKDYFNIIRKGQNFLNHADRDPDEVLEWPTRDTEALMLAAVLNGSGPQARGCLLRHHGPKRRLNMLPDTPKATICLWYDHTAEEAARFYAQTFPASSVGAIRRAPGDYPGGQQGSALVVEFTVLGIACIGLNGGPVFHHSEAFSFAVRTTDQEETDRYWNALIGNGGREAQCGWCKDKWGVSWQITPVALTEGLADADPAARKRVFEAMMGMKKLDVATLVAARRG